MKDFFVDLLNGYPLTMGIIMIIVGSIWLVYKTHKKESFRMKDHGLFSWQVLIGSWGLIVFLILWGIILIIRNL